MLATKLLLDLDTYTLLRRDVYTHLLATLLQVFGHEYPGATYSRTNHPISKPIDDTFVFVTALAVK